MKKRTVVEEYHNKEHEEKATQEQRQNDEREHDERELTCPECGATEVVEDPERGETVCDECGLVVDDRYVDQGPEWRAHDSAERDKKSRVGNPITETMHDRGLSTEIDWRDRDASGSSLSSEQRNKMRRLRRWHKQAQARGKERTLRYALGEIERMSSALNVPDHTQEIAAVIFRRAHSEDLLPGRSAEAMSAASLYAAARQENLPRSLDEVAEVSRVDERELARSYRYLVRELELEIGPTSPAEFVPKIASELGVTDEVETKAIEIVEETAEMGLTSGKSPKGYAAAAIYLASILVNDRRTQNEI
ncbi:MAG: transcription initiation factor IIB, partial [Halobacteriales archaeon]